MLLAHNEDWLPDDEDDVYVVHVRPNDEAPFLAMSYGGLLPNVGFNAHGIAQLIDSVHPEDSRIGIPRLVVSRAVLAAPSPTDAINRAVVAQRAAGYNHLLAHESGEIYSVEVSARRFAILYANDGYMAHTNNFLSPRMQEIECDPERLISSQVGYFRALRLLRDTDKHTVESLQAIQKDHVDFPNSICNHAITDSSPLDREKTINALVIDLTAREMHIAWGNPCQNSYQTFRLDE
jgi:isopenicillin-N N-acyltransferase-like protein